MQQCILLLTKGVQEATILLPFIHAALLAPVCQRLSRTSRKAMNKTFEQLALAKYLHIRYRESGEDGFSNFIKEHFVKMSLIGLRVHILAA